MSANTKKKPTISIASYQPITEKKPWRMTGAKDFCINCMTDKSFFIENYKTCTDQCVHRFQTSIDPSEQTSSSSSSYRSKQIDYYNFLVERECKLAKTWTVEVGEKNRTCFVNGWDEHAFLKLRTQDCGLTNNIALVALFSMYTLIPYIRVSQISPHRLDRHPVVKQEELFSEFTLCPTWTFPAELFLNLLFQKGRKRETEEKDETEGGFDKIYFRIILALQTHWKNALSKNPGTKYLCGNIAVPGHVISYCMGKNGMREIFDSNGTPKTFLFQTKKEYKEENQLEIVTSRVIKLENKIIDHILHNPNLNLPNEILGFYFVPLILTIISLAMSSFNPLNGGFFSEEDRSLSLKRRWPVSVNRKPLQHDGSCGMWCIFYLFLRVLMVKFDSRALQNVFKKFTDEADYKCVYKAPLQDQKFFLGSSQRKRKPPRKMDDDDKDPSNFPIAPVLTNVTLCSGDLGRVFWFSLFKAFEACVGTRPGSPRVFLECTGDADPNPGQVFINYFCVIRDLLPDDVTRTLGCKSSEMPQEFYPLVGQERLAAALERVAFFFLVSNPSRGVEGLEKIISLGSKILHDPKTPKWRMIKLKNPTFNKKIGSLKYGMILMEAAGFTRATRNDGEEVFYMTDENVEELEGSITRLKDALRTFLAIKPM